MKLFSFIFFVFVFLAHPVFAEDTFYPEAVKDLEKENAWAKVIFKNNETTAYTVFRVWFPYSADVVWQVLIDTNNMKNLHSEYLDSRTLDQDLFNQATTQKPKDLPALYKILGDKKPSSFVDQKKGKLWTSHPFWVMNFPWPLSNRWTIMEAKNDETLFKKGIYKFEYEMKLGTFKSAKGYWELIPVEAKPGWTEFRGEWKVDPGISIPKFLANKIFPSGVKRNAKENLAEMKKKFGEPAK